MSQESSCLVSVNIITYNHGKYIEEAINGALMQKTTFPFELVICDDYSTDSTRAILNKYQRKYPDMVKLRFRNKNLGLKSNYFDNINACSGKYIAICEGDDYWTDENKLQKQINFLETNSEYSMCFHSGLEMHEYENLKSTSNIFSVVYEREYTGEEILSNWLIPTASVVFKKPSSLDFKYLEKFLFYDIILFLKLYENGKIFCLNDVMCVYRRHPNSVTNSNLSYLSYIQHLIYLNKEFHGKYAAIVNRCIALEYMKRSKYAFNSRSISFISHAFKSIWHDKNPLISLLAAKLSF
ncbi:glycosyltransferase [Spirosoma sp. BT702]|uniref:Glycosyltransferase n=1 Tax=Spirosoma profusum TaxID=2771354 RepID=A0A927AQK5_9BACT|nr:glycosyltransferase [Spirosoma profusum]MBD2700676.1 glycosyltransferase [Spirosoma profusum]